PRGRRRGRSRAATSAGTAPSHGRLRSRARASGFVICYSYRRELVLAAATICTGDTRARRRDRDTAQPTSLRQPRWRRTRKGPTPAPDQLFFSWTATKRVSLPDLTRISTALRPSLVASLTPLTRSSGLFTARSLMARITSPDLMPFCAASEALSTSVTTTVSLLQPLPGATVSPSCSISVPCGWHESDLPFSTLASSLPDG